MVTPTWSMNALLVLITILINLPSSHSFLTKTARGRIPTVLFSCGHFGEEVFYNHSEIFLSPSDRILKRCNAGDFNPAFLTDEDDLTFWQSASRSLLYNSAELGFNSLDTVITLDMKQIFFVQSLTLMMGSSKRPRQISIEKSIDGITWERWLYKVSTDTECSTRFGEVISAWPATTDGFICTSYGYALYDEFELISFSISAIPIQEWKKTQWLRIKFYGMHLTLGVTGDRFQHYTIRELEVISTCDCNSLETECFYSNSTDSYLCACGGFTVGERCESCLPMYNQLPYETGQACLGCECHGKAESCVYNETVAQLNASLAIDGTMHGGGVCVECSSHTEGINCERCESYFYRPSNKTQLDAEPCHACLCSLEGTVPHPQTELLGDCIADEAQAQSFQMNAGDCFCKERVFGEKCETCVDGFFNLTAKNPAGCEECRCHLPGSVSSSNSCNATTGDCPCKPHVQGALCDTCRDGFYQLQASNHLGCAVCECDIGGSETSVCDTISGQCACLPHVINRQCDRCETGFYYPDLPLSVFEPENTEDDFLYHQPNQSGRHLATYSGSGYIQVNSNWQQQFLFEGLVSNFSLTDDFTILISYSSNDSLNLTIDLASANLVQSQSINLPPCDAWCYSESLFASTPLTSDQLVYIDISTADQFLLDHIAFIPTRFGSNISPNCSLDRRITSATIGPDCKQEIFSATVEYYGGGTPCDCHMMGSVSSACSEFGGQCPCRFGVEGRQCNACLPSFYNLTAAGCSACGCYGLNPICDVNTRQCTCEPTTTGLLCEQCQENYWDWTPAGCKSCGCHPLGTTSGQCDLFTGLCDCKPGVVGVHCDTCAPGFYNLTEWGCSPCLCDISGSTIMECHNVTGQCFCKENVDGRTCSQCTAGSFLFGGDDQRGCISCQCMSLTEQCQSFNTSIPQLNLDLVGATPIFLNRTVPAIIIQEEDNSLMAPAIPNLYIRIFITGRVDWLLYYGSDLQMIYYPEPILVPQNFALVYLETQMMRIHFMLMFSPGAQTSLKFLLPIREDGWQTDSNQTLTRGQFLTFLSMVEYLYLPLGVGSQLTRISDVDLHSSSGELVEDCECGPEYVGTSCQECAFGHARRPDNSTSLGTCAPCLCNNHSQSCDSDSGECTSCLHDTTGFSCNSCLPGFYGDPTQGTSADCTSCPCYQARVFSPACEINNTSQLICTDCKPGYEGNLCQSCADFYYSENGLCFPCDCNNRSAACNNTSGECLDCKNNTQGWYCERCTDGFYGNVASSCQQCGCDVEGSLSPVCDDMIGQCDCSSNVTGRTCDQCLFGYWDFSNQGCRPCDCVASGSLSAQCDMITGQCPCRNNATGVHCELCSLGRFGLPKSACRECQCDDRGSLNSSLPCDVYSGQCDCWPGVTGLNCDRCMDMHFNFTSQGCTECSECEKKLANRTDSTTSVIESTQESLSKLKSLVDVSNMIDEEHRNLQRDSYQFDRMERLQTNISRYLNYSNTSLMNSQHLNDILLKDLRIVNITLYLIQEETTLISHRLTDINLTKIHNEIVQANGTANVANQSYSILVESLSTLKVNIASLNERLSTVNISDYEQNTLDVHSNLEELRLWMKDLTSFIGELEGKLEDTTGDISSLDTRLDYLSEIGDSLDNRSSENERNITDLESINSSLMILEDEIDALDQEVKSTVNQSSQKINQLEEEARDLNQTWTENVNGLTEQVAKEAEFTTSLLTLEDMYVNMTQSSIVVELLEQTSSSLTTSMIWLNNTRDENKLTMNLYEAYSNLTLLTNITLERMCCSIDYDLYISLYSDETRFTDTLNAIRALNETSLKISLGVANKLKLLQDSIGKFEELSIEETKLSDLTNRVKVDVLNVSYRLENISNTSPNNTNLALALQDNLDGITSRQLAVLSDLINLQPTLASYLKLASVLNDTLVDVANRADILNATVYYNRNISVSNNNTITDILMMNETVVAALPGLEERLASLEARLARLKGLVAQADLPIRFEGQKTVNLLTTVESDYFEMSVDFRRSANDTDSSVLLQINLSNTTSQFLLAFFGESLQLGVVRDGQQTVLVNTRELMCRECWISITMSLYNDTMVMSISPRQSLSGIIHHTVTHPELQYLTSGVIELMLGGAAGGQRYFKGCISFVRQNNKRLEFSDEDLQLCGCIDCFTPRQLTLTGFGYARFVSPAPISIISFCLRTFSPDGALFNTSTTMLELTRGKLKLTSSATQESSSTTGYYNYGYDVTISCQQINVTQSNCAIISGVYEEVLSVTAPLTRGGERIIAFGDERPNVNRMAGCLKELQVNGRFIRSLEEFSSYEEINEGCPSSPVPGLILTPGSRLLINPYLINEDLMSISLQMATVDTLGSIIQFSTRSLLVEVSIVHGYLEIVKSETGFDLAWKYRYGGVFLSDARLYNIEISLVPTLKVEVNGQNQEPSTTTFDTSNAPNQTFPRLQLGQYSSVISVGPTFPSLSVGISRLNINRWTIPLLSSSIYILHESGSLVGFAVNVQEQPVTLTLPNLETTTVSPTCAPPTSDSTTLLTGRRFGDYPVSFIQYDFSEEASAFARGSAITLRFRALSPSGILLYIADNKTLPQSWLAVYLEEGQLHFSAQTDLMGESRIKLSGDYSNGIWTSVICLRLHNFMAMLVEASRDYVNNRQSHMEVSAINMNSELYIGGVPSRVHIPPSIPHNGFSGCIDSVTFSSSLSQGHLRLNLSTPNESFGTSNCFSAVEIGYQLSGHTSYILLADNLTLFRGDEQNDLHLQFSIRSHQSNNLLVVLHDEWRFFSLYTNNSKLNIMFGHFNNDERHWLSGGTLAPHATICDTLPDTLSINLTLHELLLTVNGVTQTWNLMLDASWTIENGKLLIGGVQDGVSFPPFFDEPNLAGCVNDVQLDEEEFHQLKWISQSNMTVGCQL